MSEAVQRYVAFSDRPDGGNPAGVVLDAARLSDARMLAIAAELGYSETAFLSGTTIRYFSPLAEVLAACPLGHGLGSSTCDLLHHLVEEDSMPERERATRGPLVALAAFASLVALAAHYRAWHLAWGATEAEASGPMPGDELLERAQFVATRAISIAAPPDQVWPWLVQVGFGRAGFYSYDLLDNLGHPSADEVLSEFQSPSVGDLAAPMSSPADERTAFRVASIEEPSVLVWSKPDSTWAWRLASDGRGGTRLVTRLKARYDPGPFLPVTVLLMEVGDFPMMRRMLLGIAERATRSSP